MVHNGESSEKVDLNLNDAGDAFDGVHQALATTVVLHARDEIGRSHG